MALLDHELERSMILVMGVTGSGKSYFINKLAKDSVVEGHGVRSETSDCQIVQVAVGSDVVALVDTPGFDDTQRSDSEILEQIVEFLCAQYKLGIPLKGIIYMHRITDNKMSGSARRYLEMFTRLCGDRNLENVVLLTTMWSELKDQGKGMERERELRRDFWDAMESRGSKIRKFDGTQSMASALVHRLQRKQDIVLEIQEQLVDEGRQLDQTEAGKLMVPQIEVAIEKSEQKLRDLSKRGDLGVGRGRSEVKELEQQRGSLVEQRKRLQSRPGETISGKIEGQRKRDRMMSKLSIFSTVLGVALTMTVNVILPLVGVI